MKVLLDTHVVVWLSASPEKLSEKLLEMLKDKKNEVFYSLASLWELAIKSGIKRIEIDLVELLEDLKKNDIKPLSIEADHLLRVKDLIAIHKDPFDRLLIAQAITENLVLLTHDKILQKYSKKSVQLI